MKSLLELRDVNLYSKSVYRLQKINITITEGERIALLGKSGSGKSTLIKVANGSLPPTEGDVFFQDIKICNLTNKQRSLIGTFWQDLRLINELNVGQNINLGAIGRNNIIWSIFNLLNLLNKRDCLDCLKETYMPIDIINNNISNLSCGQQTRVAIARLLCQNSPLIIADEPLSNLEPILAEKILNTILSKQILYRTSLKHTSIISIHRPELIKYFTRVIGIKNGKIEIDCNINNITNKKLEELYS